MDKVDLQLVPFFQPAFKQNTFQAFQGSTTIECVSIDSRRITSPDTLFFALGDGHRFLPHVGELGVRFAVVNRDYVAPDNSKLPYLIRVDNTLKAFQEFAAYYRSTLVDTEVVAIAGSYGKTMFKELLKSILRIHTSVAASPDSFNSQIGVPLSIFTISKHDKIALIEAAVSHPGEMDVLQRIIQPQKGIITQIGKKHLHTMGDFTTNLQEIMKLFKDLKSDAWLLAPKHPLLAPYAVKAEYEMHYWSEKSTSLPYAEMTCSDVQNPQYTLFFPLGNRYQGTIVSGQSYYVDLLNMAIKAAWLLGASSVSICQILKDYIPEPTRTEIWQSALGTTFINDSQCSDPLSIDASLAMLHKTADKGRKVFVFSGLKQEESTVVHDYKRIGKALGSYPVDKLLLVGSYPYASLIEEVGLHCPETQVSICRTNDEAISLLRQEALPEDVVLLKGARRLPFDALASAFADASCANLCFINLAAVEWNLRTLKKRLGNTRIMAIVKAHAYGSDSNRMARFLIGCGVDILGVSYVDEAIVLRRSGIHAPLFVINTPPHEAAKVVDWNLEPGVSSIAGIEALEREAAKAGKQIKVHLHVDTGMCRFGCRVEEAVTLAKMVLQSKHLILEGIMTHFACADDPAQDTFTLNQVKAFDKAIADVEALGYQIPWKHAANSAAAIRFELPQYNMARIGLALWGLHSSEACQQRQELKLALSLISQIEAINISNRGETVSYGRAYTTTRDKQAIAVLRMGYFDGLHRHYSGKAHVMINGHKAPMVGNICMDYMMVDVTDIPHAKVGDPVLIFGTDQFGQFLSPENLASAGNSIAHELITCLGPRIPRIFVYEEAL